jgi:hypothetical protein
VTLTAKDSGTLEYVFETDGKDVPQTVTKEKVAEIAADSYYQLLRCPGPAHLRPVESAECFRV